MTSRDAQLWLVGTDLAPNSDQGLKKDETLEEEMRELPPPGSEKFWKLLSGSP